MLNEAGKGEILGCAVASEESSYSREMYEMAVKQNDVYGVTVNTSSNRLLRLLMLLFAASE